MASNHSIPERISELVKGSIIGFIRRLTASYDGLTPEDLVQIWNSDADTANLINITVESISAKSKPKSTRTKKPTSKAGASSKTPTPPTPSSPSSSDATSSTTAAQPMTCGYILTKGARADQPCGLKSRRGGIFCSRHKAHENTCKPCTKSIPVASRASPKKVKSSSEEFNNDALTFRKHDTIPDCYYHTVTNFVRKSGGGLYVDRKIVDGELVPLTAADLDVCKANQLTMSPELLQKETTPTTPTLSKTSKSRKSESPPKSVDTIQTLDSIETDVRSAILNMNTDAIAIEAVLRELQVSPRIEK